jgi:hypothetical protein
LTVCPLTDGLVSTASEVEVDARLTATVIGVDVEVAKLVSPE